jgi:hypothetical protein
VEPKPLAVGEIIAVEIERMPDGLVHVYATNRSRNLVLVHAYVGGESVLQQLRFTIVADGIVYEAT